MTPALLSLLVLGPIFFAFLAYVAPGDRSRNLIVVLAAIVTASAGIYAAWCSPSTLGLSVWDPWGPWLAFGLEILWALVFIYLGARLKSWAIVILGLSHLSLILIQESLRLQNPVLNQAPVFTLDPLSLILLLIVCVIGSLIVLYAIGYMRNHQAHAPFTAGSTGSFFLFLIGFLGVMNGLVLSDSIQWTGIFWEVTTICSAMLIIHDRTPQAIWGARRALLIGAFGGLANMVASTLCLTGYGVTTLSGLMAASALAPMALLCLGAMTKSALMPFQSWLLGAMVAPTPVSALLHSATMVKAGSYMILRLAPAFTGHKLMDLVALAGAFSFALTSALAIGQSDSKKVLAYSTISNLGLIVACAGINTPLAYMAALMILCFHAASKGLLFLCVGTIEQRIGSREIEDMYGIRFRMPVTTTITLIGMASMLIPPFGMLLSKWMAIEAAIDSPVILMLFVVGSALTVVFWVKWMGRIQTVSYHPEEPMEEILPSMRLSMLIKVAIVLVLGIAAVPIYQMIFNPLVVSIYQGRLLPMDEPRVWAQLEAFQEFSAWPVLILLALAFLAWPVIRLTFKISHLRLPFLCGENLAGEGLFFSFHGLKDQVDTAWSPNPYMISVFAERPITFWANLFAGVIALSMFAVIGLI